MSTLIFGILNIGFALMKLVAPLVYMAVASLKLPGNAGLAALRSDPVFAAWTKFSMCVGVAMGLALLAFGIGLLLLKNWARIGSMVYSVIDIIFVLVGSVVGLSFTQHVMQQVQGAPPAFMAGFAVICSVIGVVIGLVYPALLLFFMTRANVIEACQPEQPPAPV
jgi:ABC-type sulfate transport system permease component